MPQPTPSRVHLFHGTHLLATLHGSAARPEPYYTLDDGTVVQSITYLAVTHSDGSSGYDVQVVPVVPVVPAGSGDVGREGREVRTGGRDQPRRTGFRA